MWTPRRGFTKRPLDLFHLDGERGFRGGERQLLYLAAALRAQGHRNFVVCRGGSPLEAEASRLGLATRRLPFLGEWDPLSAVKLRSLALRTENPILHAHTAHAAGVAVLATRGSSIPFVAHRRVDFPLNGSLSARWKYGLAGAVVGVSQAIRTIVAEGGVDPAKIQVVCDGLPVDSEERGWAGMEADRFDAPSPDLRKSLAAEYSIDPCAAWVGNLAALVPHKDHDTLLAAAVLVLQKRPSAVFLIAGEGPEGPRLLESIRRMGLLGKVLLLGHLSDPIPLLRSLDVLAHSSWGEGMGSVLLEAAACGVPIAATSAGGIPEIVEDGVSGLLTPARDPEGLAKAILRLIADRGLAQRLAAEGRKRLARFGLRRMARQMETIYAGLRA